MRTDSEPSLTETMADTVLLMKAGINADVHYCSSDTNEQLLVGKCLEGKLFKLVENSKRQFHIYAYGRMNHLPPRLFRVRDTGVLRYPRPKFDIEISLFYKP
jgi:hypothetical protein